MLGLDALHARLARRLDLLAGGRRGVEARQATLRSAIEWSWDLLDEDDRRALARGSVFRGGFSLAAADAVLGEPRSAALDRVQSLRDKSLLRAAPRAPGGPVRFSLYEGVRELAAEKLAERGDGALAAGRHATYFLAEGEAAARAWESTGAVEALDRIGDDLENLLAVVEGALARDDAGQALRALLVIDPVLSTRGPFGTHLELLDRALRRWSRDPPRTAGARAEDRDAAPLLEARALAARGRARHLRGNDEGGLADLRGGARPRPRARRRRDRGRHPHGHRGDSPPRPRARRGAGPLRGGARPLPPRRRPARRGPRARQPGRAAPRSAPLRRGHAPLRAGAGDRGGRRRSAHRGDLRHQRGPARAGARRGRAGGPPLRAGRRHPRGGGDLRLLAISLGSLGTLHQEEGRIEEARAYHERAAALLHEVGDSRSEARAWGRLGAALAALGRLEEARAALARGERLILHAGDAIGTQLLGVARGFLDLALARAARIESRPEEAAVHLADLRRRMGSESGAASLADRSDDLRLYLRMLDRGLSAMDSGAAPGGSEAGLELLLAPGGRWCRPPGGAWQDLRERHAVRRLLVCLVQGRRDAPGRGVSLDALREAGWPGERMLPQAAQNRIYVAVNQLRKLGLKDLLHRGSEGYFLDPALPVHYTGVEPTSA